MPQNKWAKKLLSLSVVYSVITSLLYFAQAHLLYHPTTAPIKTSQPILTIDNQGTKIEVLFQNQPKEDAVIYFAGNAENVYYSIKTMKQSLDSRAMYFMSYRGYNNSEGKPSEKALFSDSLALYDHLKKSHRKISVIGRSIGSGVAGYLASKRNVESLILITPYDSIREVAANKFPIFPVSMLIKDHYDTASFAKSLSMPVLLLIADNDIVIPRERSEELYRSLLKEKVTKRILSNTGHNDIHNHPDFMTLINKFI